MGIYRQGQQNLKRQQKKMLRSIYLKDRFLHMCLTQLSSHAYLCSSLSSVALKAFYVILFEASLSNPESDSVTLCLLKNI